MEEQNANDLAAALEVCRAALTQIQGLSAGAVIPYVREINTLAEAALVQTAGAAGAGPR